MSRIEVEVHPRRVELFLVTLPVSRLYRSYDSLTSWYTTLDLRFPDQFAATFTYVCYYQVMGPAERYDIMHLRCVKESTWPDYEWVWEVRFDDNSLWRLRAWMGRTGWTDSKSWSIWVHEPQRGAP